MVKPLIMVSSINYAIKGKQILSSYGIKSEIERTPKRSASTGCGYSLYVPERTDEAEEILISKGIKIKGRSERENEL